MDFVDKEHGADAAAQAAGGLAKGAELGDIAHYAAGALKAAVGGAGDDFGKRGLPGAGRTVEDEIGEAVALDDAAEQAAGR